MHVGLCASIQWMFLLLHVQHVLCALHVRTQVTVVVGDASAVAPVMKAAGFSVIPLELQKP